jgi:hypothetical protein
MSGPGRIHEKRKGDTSLILLYNFDIAKDDVKLEHQIYLIGNVAPLFRKPKPPFIFLRGMASRTGAPGYNLSLSRRRVERVIAILRNNGVPSNQIIRSDFVGEAKSKQADETESEWDRAVLISIGYSQVPPPDFQRDPEPPPNPQEPDPQEIERQIDRLVRQVQHGLVPPRRGAGDDRFNEEVSRYLSHIEGYIKAMSEIWRRGRGPLPNVDLFYPNWLHYERPGFQKALDAWRELGDPNLERQRTPPHACIDDTPIQRKLLLGQNFGRITNALRRFYNDESRRLGR